MPAHWLTTLIINFTLFFTVLYWFFLLPQEKAVKVALWTCGLASLTMTALFYNLLDKLGLAGGLLILAMWVVPAIYVGYKRSYFQGLNQRTLMGLQIFRLIGGLFLLEMARGNIPPSFAYPAGIGDIIVGLIAAYFFIFYKKIPNWGVMLVIILGLIDFISAFLFGFTSQPGPQQLFAQLFENKVNMFPTGMIPIFLVPYAIVNHVLAWNNLKN